MEHMVLVAILILLELTLQLNRSGTKYIEETVAILILLELTLQFYFHGG